MSARKNNANETVTIRDRALSFGDVKVKNMIDKINASFARRAEFEAKNGLDLSAANSFTKAQAKMNKNANAVARLFLALSLEPSAVIERQVQENKMFNAKALDKVTEIAVFVSGYGERLQRVTRAFIACGLIASDKGLTDITNDVNKRFLNRSDLSAYITDKDILENIESLRHAAMSSGAETQSSQARNVLDVLGIGSIKSIHKSRDAIAFDLSNDFFALFRERFMKQA